jgi:hypothetical protein
MLITWNIPQLFVYQDNSSIIFSKLKSADDNDLRKRCLGKIYLNANFMILKF